MYYYAEVKNFCHLLMTGEVSVPVNRVLAVFSTAALYCFVLVTVEGEDVFNVTFYLHNAGLANACCIRQGCTCEPVNNASFQFPTLAALTYLKEVFLQSTQGPDESNEPGCCLAILG